MTDAELEDIVRKCKVECTRCRGFGLANFGRTRLSGASIIDVCPTCHGTGRVLPSPVQQLAEEVRRLQAERDALALPTPPQVSDPDRLAYLKLLAIANRKHNEIKSYLNSSDVEFLLAEIDRLTAAGGLKP